MPQETSSAADEDHGSLKSRTLRLVKEWFSGGAANAITSSILNPMDVAKTRMQALQPRHSSSTSLIKPSLGRTLHGMYASGGVKGLWSPGLSASIIRELLSSGTRAGMYVPVRNIFNSVFTNATIEGNPVDETGSVSSEVPLIAKICAAMTTGIAGALLANPIDVIKVRMMVDPVQFRSISSTYSTLAVNEGWNGLYKGLTASTLRAAFIAVGELATYDHSKHILHQLLPSMREGVALHIMASLVTGLVATTVAAPFDLLKTRAMNASKGESANIVKAASEVIRREGPLVLLRGWVPAYLRLGPHALLCFPIFEQIRHFIGLDYL